MKNSPPSCTSFEQLLASTSLPPPGPEHYAVRRALWLRPITDSKPPYEPSKVRDKLETILSSVDAVNNDKIWRDDIEKIWRGLSTGGKLKHRLPLNLVMKIIHAAWVRDDTWPRGTIARDSDGELAHVSAGNMVTLPTRPVPIGTIESSSNIPSTLTEDINSTKIASGMAAVSSS